jgi:hypothetical protein
MGSGVSRLTIALDHDEGQTELLPIAAGSCVRGKVTMELSRDRHGKQGTRGGGGEDASHDSAGGGLFALQLRLYGKEKVRVHRGKARVVSRGSLPSPKCAERLLFDTQSHWTEFPSSSPDSASSAAGGGGPPHDETPTLTTTPSIVEAGTYVFPFALQLPALLPSSTYYPVDTNRSRGKLRFRIQYKLEATVLDKSKITTTASSSAVPKKAAAAVVTTTTRYLWIAASAPQVPLEPIPCMIEPVAHQIKGPGGFFEKGKVLFGAAVDDCRVVYNPKNNYETNTGTATNGSTALAVPVAAAVADGGSDIMLHVSCRNDSSVTIQNVKIQILEMLQWGTTVGAAATSSTTTPDGSGVVRTVTTLQQRETRVLATLPNVQLPGLARERKGFLKLAFHRVIGGGSHEQRLQRQIYDDLISGENCIPLTLPRGHGTVRETFAGQLIQVLHCIQIDFQTGAFLNSPSVTIPIYVLGSALPLPLPAVQLYGDSTNNEQQAHLPIGTDRAYHIPVPKSAKAKAKPMPPPSSKKMPKKPTIPAITGLAPHATAEDIERATSSSAKESAPAKNTNKPVLVLGGNAITTPSPSQRLIAAASPLKTSERDLADLVPMLAPKIVNVETLCGEMRSSIDEYYLLANDKLNDESWLGLVQALSPADYGRIVSCVPVALDQVRVAMLLAPHVDNFTCQHVVEAVRIAADHRAIMVQRLLPLTVDRTDPKSHELVRMELNDWEQTVATVVLMTA